MWNGLSTYCSHPLSVTNLFYDLAVIIRATASQSITLRIIYYGLNCADTETFLTVFFAKNRIQIKVHPDHPLICQLQCSTTITTYFGTLTHCFDYFSVYCLDVLKS